MIQLTVILVTQATIKLRCKVIRGLSDSISSHKESTIRILCRKSVLCLLVRKWSDMSESSNFCSEMFLLEVHMFFVLSVMKSL